MGAQGGPVRCHVVDMAGAGGCLVLTPAPARLGKVLEALAAEVAELPQLAGLGEVGEVAERRREAVRERGHVLYPRLLRRLEHLHRLAAVEPERFLREDVFPRRDGRHTDLVVRVVGRSHDHRVDLRVGDQLLVVCRGADRRPVRLALLQQSLDRVGDHDELGARVDVDAGHVCEQQFASEQLRPSSQAGSSRATSSRATTKIGSRWKSLTAPAPMMP